MHPVRQVRNILHIPPSYPHMYRTVTSFKKEPDDESTSLSTLVQTLFVIFFFLLRFSLPVQVSVSDNASHSPVPED